MSTHYARAAPCAAPHTPDYVPCTYLFEGCRHGIDLLHRSWVQDVDQPVETKDERHEYNGQKTKSGTGAWDPRFGDGTTTRSEWSGTRAEMQRKT